MDPILSRIEQDLKSDFDKNYRILTFDEYMSLVAKEPRRHTRGSAQYMLDMMDHFGTSIDARSTSSNEQSEARFKLFDMAFDDPKYRVVGQNDVQLSIYRSLQNFVKEGINNKLILLHGPNGSAKSSIVQCLTKGLEHYSETTEGACYRFNWIFPVDRAVKGNLGLGAYANPKNQLESFAKLPDEDVAARVCCELKDHPLLLLPAAARVRMIREYGVKDNLPDYLAKGSLCQKCKQIFEALLTSHKGDLRKVLMHVQIERFYVSKRYRTAAVTIEPQMHIDAQSRQITMDRSLSFLPPSLQSMSLYELSGDLVDGNRGIIEYSDLLKRPVDTFKYLLIACEMGSVNIQSSIAYLDSVLIGSTNELQMDAFKEFPDFTSFKARIELVRVPYLLSYSQEKKIYDVSIHKMAAAKHISPHTTFVAGLWAVLSRLKKPNSIHYPPNVTNLVGNLSPMEKARLYDHGGVPHGLSPDEKKLLRSQVKRLHEEYNAVPYYEGRMGASARELKSILFDAAQNPEFDCLSPLSVLREMEQFVKKVMEYDFLKQDIKDGYHDCGEFINTVRTEYLQMLDQEVRESMGVFESRQYGDFLKKYVIHLSHLLKKEKIKNPVTGKMESPDMPLIDQFENIAMPGSAAEQAAQSAASKDTFRNNIISAIGAYALDHPNEAVDYKMVFPDFMQKLEDHYFSQQKAQMTQLGDAIALFGTDKEDSTADHHKLARLTVKNMSERFGYCEKCAPATISFLIKSKY